MPVVSTSACVLYTPQEMYQLVNQVSDYPEFIPLCSEARIYASDPSSMRASITMVKGGLRLNFATENVLTAGQSIEMNLLQGPFRKLKGLWTFESLDNGGCEIRFRLDFEFANALLGMAFGGFFREVGDAMVAAFCRRAQVVYGERKARVVSVPGAP